MILDDIETIFIIDASYWINRIQHINLHVGGRIQESITQFQHVSTVFNMEHDRINNNTYEAHG